jgi:hypothetical protein
MNQRIIRALLFGFCITCIGVALFVLLTIVFDDGGANERSIPYIESPLNFLCAGILWPITLTAFLTKGDLGAAVWILLSAATVLFWGGISDFAIKKFQKRLPTLKS